MADVFISYASEDRDRAHAIADALMARGWTVWWDRQILPGESFESVIERELSSADCVVVLWSASSVQSHWAKAEAEEALQRGVLVPALIDDVRIPIAFRHVQAASLIDWSSDAADHAGFAMLLQSISNLDRPDPAAATAASVAAAPSGAAPPRDRGTARTGRTQPAPVALQGAGKGVGLLRSHPRAALIGGALVLVIGVLGAYMIGGGAEDDPYDPEEASAAPAAEALDAEVESREREALDSGYEIVDGWQESELSVSEPMWIEVEAHPGETWHVLGSTTADCELGIDIPAWPDEDASGPVETLEFSVASPETVSVRVDVFSQTRSTCTIGTGLYREVSG